MFRDVLIGGAIRFFSIPLISFFNLSRVFWNYLLTRYTSDIHLTLGVSKATFTSPPKSCFKRIVLNLMINLWCVLGVTCNIPFGVISLADCYHNGGFAK